MIRILFVCLGNICRSPMAEFVFKEMVKKQGKDSEFYVESAATSNETAGQPVHFGTRKKLSEIGISTEGKYARQLKQSDYDRFDYIIGMEEYNINCIKELSEMIMKIKFIDYLIFLIILEISQIHGILIILILLIMILLKVVLLYLRSLYNF